MTKQEIQQLKALCHKLKPVVRIGQKGLTDSVFNEIESALDHHELIKIKVSSTDKASRQKIVDEICARSQSEMIQSIGYTISFYRKTIKS